MEGFDGDIEAKEDAIIVKGKEVKLTKEKILPASVERVRG